MSAFAGVNHKKALNAMPLRKEESLESEVGNCIDFSNAILKNENINKVEPIVYYSLRKCKQKVSYDILTEISQHVTLLQLMDSSGNVNHAISLVG